jgi:hypothetical protein
MSFVSEPQHGQCLLALPPLHATDGTIQIHCDLLPGIQPHGAITPIVWRDSDYPGFHCTSHSVQCAPPVPFPWFAPCDRAGSPPAPARTADWSAIRAGQHLTGRKIEQSCGASAPHRVTDEVTLLCAIPAFRGTATLAVLFLLRREQSVRVNWSELLLLAKQAGFRFPQSSRAFARALFGGSNAHLHHTVDLVLGTSGGRFSVRCVNTPASCLRRNSCLHHSTISRGGNNRPKYFPLLCR